MNNKKAIILAAGLGSRLKPLTEKEHKCMTKVCGTPIIYNTLKNLEKSGFSEVIIVVGYLREMLMKQISDFNISIKITFAENNLYDQTNTIFSLQRGLEKLTPCDEVYIIEGDVFFDNTVLARLINSDAENATILEPYNEKLEGSFAELSEKYVCDWRHRSDQEESYVITDKFKTVNLHKFSYNFVIETLEKALSAKIESDGLKTPIEKAMRLIVNNSNKIIAGEVLNGEKWYEIDDVNDLKIAEDIFGGV